MSVGEHCHEAPYTVSGSSSVRSAACMMRDFGVGSLIVVEASRPVGVLTDRDVALEILCEQLDPDSVEVRSLLTGPAISVRCDADLRDAMQLLRRYSLRRLPVVDDAGKLVGIVTSDDLLGRLAGEIDGVARAAMAHPPKRPLPLVQIQDEAAITREE